MYKKKYLLADNVIQEYQPILSLWQLNSEFVLTTPFEELSMFLILVYYIGYFKKLISFCNLITWLIPIQMILDFNSTN